MSTPAPRAPRVTLITLGVASLTRAKAFYSEGLGFQVSSHSTDDVVFLDAGSLVISLYPRHLLAEDAQLSPEGSGFGGIALAHNAASKLEVDEVLARAQAAGARLLKAAQEVFWGGYSGYFADLDGYPWEVAYNPHWSLDPAGAIVLPA